MKHISSADNPSFKALLRLHQSSRERKKAGLSLLDGIHLVAAYIEHVGAPEQVVVGRSALDNREIAALLGCAGMPAPLVLGDGLMRELSSVATPTGIVAAVRTPREPELPARPGPCVMLEDIQDPGNLGSILRSCAAAAIEDVFLSRDCVQAWSPRVLRAGMGAHFALRVHEAVDLVALARAYDGAVLVTMAGGDKPYFECDLTGRVALVFGNEGAGVSALLRQESTGSMSIPMPGKAESLNVAAAAAVCLFDRVRQLATAAGAPLER